MGSTQALLKRGQQLQGEHRCLLEGKEEFFAIHFDHLTVSHSTGCAMAPVVGFDKRAHAKHLARQEVFPSTIRPDELNLAGENTVNGITSFTGLIQQLLSVDKPNGQAPGKGLDRMQS